MCTECISAQSSTFQNPCSDIKCFLYVCRRVETLNTMGQLLHGIRAHARIPELKAHFEGEGVWCSVHALCSGVSSIPLVPATLLFKVPPPLKA